METSTILREVWDATRLRLLVEIDRRGSVSAAARAIGIGQPTASQHLRVLERAAGRQLVERNGKGSRLTEAGRVIAARAVEALNALELADEELRALDGLVAGTIHLGASTAPGAYLLPDVLGCFRRDYPGVTVDVEVASSGDVLRRLLEGRVQLAIVGAQTADPKIVLDPFLEDEIVGIARPGLLPLVDGKLAPAEIGSLTLLSRESGSSSRDLVEAELRAARVWPRERWELGSPEAIKRAAREGLGIAFLSRYAVAEDVEAERLETFRLAGRPPLCRNFFVARLATRPATPSEREFVATLTRCCAKSATYAEACVGAVAASKVYH